MDHLVSSRDVETHVAPDRAAFARIARALARRARPGDVFALAGPLGAGKTTFVREFVAALGGGDAATSPTFTLRHRYVATPPVEHLDLYRIEPGEELAELGLDDAFASDVIALVEWPDRAPSLLPPATVRVAIEGVGEGPRTVTIARPLPP